MQSAERRALVLLLGLAVAGHAVRWVVGRPQEAPGAIEIVSVLPGRSPAAHRESTMALARRLEPGERVDVDRATAAELARLPQVGMALAKRIVADREARGAFGSLTGLDRVPGVGPGLLRTIAEHVTFGGISGTAGVVRGASAAVPAAAAAPSDAPVSLNSATEVELQRLPGIGPARARAIVQDRTRNGPFPSVEALTRVPGISPALVQRLHHLVRVP